MKRNRKLFAILTLVAFMMTLLPLAAFAAPADANRNASILTVDKTKVQAEPGKYAKFTVYVRNNNNKAEVAPIYVASERGLDTDKFEYKDTDGTWKPVTDLGDYFALSGDSKYEFRVNSFVAGDADIAVGLTPAVPANNVFKYLTDSNVKAAEANIIGTKTITFEASDADAFELVSVSPRTGLDLDTNFYPYYFMGGSVRYYVSDNYSIFYVNASGDYVDSGIDVKASAQKGVSIGGVTVDVPAQNNLNKTRVVTPALQPGQEAQKANGSDYYELVFQLKNKAGAPVEGEKVQFNVNKSNARLNKSEATTDEIGEVKVRVYAEKHGEYEVEARKGSTYLKVALNFAASSIDSFEVVSSPDDKIAYDEDKASSLKLQLKDANGNNYDLSTGEAAALVAAEDIVFEWVTLPSDSDLDDDFFINAPAGYIVEDNGLFQAKLPALDAEGKYALKVTLANGKSHTFNFEAKEQGDIVKITLSYDEPSLALGATSKSPTVKRIDADGVKLNADTASLDWSVSDHTLLAPGYDIDANNGVIKATNDPDYTGVLTVTVIDTRENLTASTTVTIADAAVGFEVVADEAYEINKDGKASVKIVDKKGNQVALGATATNVTFDSYVVSKPEGAIVTIEESAQFAKNIREKGLANVDVYSNVAGDVTVTFVISYDDTSVSPSVARRISENVTLKFGEPKSDVVYGAKNVTLFIGSTGFVADGVAGNMDQAPFIQDNRTFVPLRAVATALGATNEDTMWDPATQTITLVRPDLTVTMTIGSNVLTLSDGSTVVADVAPFIVAETGRTVIPFRAIAEAFGADVEAVFAADGTTTAVTFSQE